MWAGLTVALKRDRDGRKLYDVSIVEDISARKEAEQCIHYLANHDALTGLPNRARFSAAARPRRARRRAVTGAGSPFCSSISIVSRSSTTRSVTRPATRCCGLRPRACAAASARATSSRGSAATSSSCCCKTSASSRSRRRVASNVLKSLAEPVAIQGRDCTVSASIGICLHPDGEQEDQAVLRNADMAMYLAKQSGKNGYRLYVNELNALSAERAAIESAAAQGARKRAVRHDVLRSARRGDERRRRHRGARSLDRCRACGRRRRTRSRPRQRRRACSCRSTIECLRAACEASAGWQRAGLAARGRGREHCGRSGHGSRLRRRRARNRCATRVSSPACSSST